MKKGLTSLLIALIFIVGALVFLYPTIANYLYEKNGSKAIIQHNEQIEKMSKEELDKEKAAVKRYNKSLLENAVVLTDPFDPDAFPITDGNYYDLLAGEEMMAYVEIPSIDVKIPIFHGTSDQVLEKGAGHLENTSLPMGGKDTHMVISAHCGLPSARLFTDLEKVKKGDVFRIYVLDEILSYKVYDIQTVLPEETTSLLIERGKDLATLITCTPYGQNTHRLMVHGKRVKEDLSEEETPTQVTVSSNWERTLAIIASILALLFILLLIDGLIRSRRKKRRG